MADAGPNRTDRLAVAAFAAAHFGRPGAALPEPGAPVVERAAADLQPAGDTDTDTRKRYPRDYALWKAHKDGEPETASWATPWPLRISPCITWVTMSQRNAPCGALPSVRDASAVWPPTGIALAAMVVWGRRMWPGVAAGALQRLDHRHGTAHGDQAERGARLVRGGLLPDVADVLQARAGGGFTVPLSGGANDRWPRHVQRHPPCDARAILHQHRGDAGGRAASAPPFRPEIGAAYHSVM